MNQEQIKGEFEQLKGAAKQLWAGLKDEDFRDATEEKIIGRVTELYGISKAEVKSKLQEVCDKAKAASSSSNSGKGAVADTIHKATDKINEYAVQGQKKVENLTDAVSEYAEQGQKKFDEAAHVAKEQGQELYNYAERYMKEKPVTTLLVALGIGALIGSIITR